MVDLLHDRAEQLRQQALANKFPDTADPSQHPYEYPWQSPNDDITGYPFVPFENPHLPRYEVTRFSLAQNIATTVTVDRAPMIWKVTNRNIANTNLLVYLNDIASGIPIDLGPGGTCTLPAHGHRQITVSNIGSGTAIGNIIALSGDSQFMNNVQISPG